MSALRIRPLGDRALTIAFGADEPDPARRALALARRLDRTPLPGVLESVPALASVTLHYTPLEIDFHTLRQRLLELAVIDGEVDAVAGRDHAVPVRYDGPDLPDVAQQTGLTVDEVIRRHAAPWYRVAVLGFVPGFAYLSELDPRLVLPRRSTPRTRVPAGSVAIAGTQAGIYPAATPGGWHLIGSTPLVLFDPDRDPAALFAVGDRVRFEPV